VGEAIVLVGAGVGVIDTGVFVALGMGVDGRAVDVGGSNVGAGVGVIAVCSVAVVPHPLSSNAARVRPIPQINCLFFIPWLLPFTIIVRIPTAMLPAPSATLWAAFQFRFALQLLFIERNCHLIATRLL